MKKTLAAAIAAAALATAACSGGGGGGGAEADPRALLETSADFMESATAVELEGVMTQEAEFQGHELSTLMNISGAQIVDPLQADIEMSVSVMGNTQEMRMIASEDGGSVNIYFQNLATGEWGQATATPEQTESLGLNSGFTEVTELLRTLPSDAAIESAPGPDSSTTVLTIPLDSETISSTVDTSTLGGADVAGTGTIVLTVKNDSGEPLSAALSMNVDAAGATLVQSMETTYSNWNVIPTITIPPEALNAPVDNSFIQMTMP